MHWMVTMDNYVAVHEKTAALLKSILENNLGKEACLAYNREPRW